MSKKKPEPHSFYNEALEVLRITAEGLDYELDTGVRNGDCIIFTCRKSGCMARIFDDGTIDGVAIKFPCPESNVYKDIKFDHGHELTDDFKAFLDKHWKSGK